MFQLDDEVRVYDPDNSYWHDEVGQVCKIKNGLMLIKIVGRFNYETRWYHKSNLRKI